MFGKMEFSAGGRTAFLSGAVGVAIDSKFCLNYGVCAPPF